MPDSIIKLAEIALAWFGYFALHSLLAADGTKAWVSRRWPQLTSRYRLLYNILAMVTLAPLLWLVHGSESAWLWQWQGAWAWLSNSVALLAALGFIAVSRNYDMDEFIGLRQRPKTVMADAQKFNLSGFHRFVRHPWYCLGLILVWTRDMNGPLLTSGLAITLYFVIGSKLEEHKLIVSYGETYRRYLTKVPGLIPLPWKYLTTEEAVALTMPERKKPLDDA